MNTTRARWLLIFAIAISFWLCSELRASAALPTGSAWRPDAPQATGDTPTPTSSPTPSPTSTPPITPTPPPTATITPTEAPPSLNLTIAGHIGGQVRALAVQGIYAYVGVGAQLVVVNVSNPAAPFEVGRSGYLGNLIGDVVVNGSTAFVTILPELIAFDVSNPANPYQIDSLGMAFGRMYLDPSLNRMYVAGANRLSVVDVSTPMTMTLLSQYMDTYTLNDVVVRSDRAYVASNAGLLTMDVTDPYSATLTNVLPGAGLENIQGLSAAGNYLYAASGADGLRVIDVFSPDAPYEVGALGTADYALDVEVVTSTNTAYLASAMGGLLAIDVTDKAAPMLIGQMDTPGNAWSLKVLGAQVFLADDDGLRIVDISQPGPPVGTGQWITHGAANDVLVVDHTAYVMHEMWAGGLRAYDVYSPTQPSFLNTLIFPSSQTTNLSVLDGTAYFGLKLEGELAAVDISSPGSLYELGKTHVSNEIYGVAAYSQPVVGRHYVCAATWPDGLQIVDVSDPQQMFVAQTIPIAGGYPRSVTVDGDYAYVAAGNEGVRIIRLTSPIQTSLEVGAYPGITETEKVVVAGSYAYVASGTDGLYILDVSLPAAPRLIGQYYTGPARSVAVVGRLVFLARGSSGVDVFDVVNPAAPRWLTNIDLPGEVSGLAAGDSYVYAAAGDAGFFILNASPSPSYALSGQVLDEMSNAVAGVEITQPGSGYIVHTDLAGAYAFQWAPGGKHFIYASKTGYNFTPRMVTVLPSGPTSGLDFAATQLTYNVIGRVTGGDGHPLVGATVSDDWGNTTRTNNLGDYNLPLTAGQHILKVMPNPEAFWPSERTVIVPPRAEQQDFTVAPQLVQIAQVDGGSSWVMAKQSNFLYINKSRVLAAFDVSNPLTPTLTGSTAPLPQNINGLVINGTYAYAANGDAGLGVINLSDPARPRLEQLITVSAGSVNNLVRSGNFLYLACSGGLQVMDITTPSSPTEGTWFGMPPAWTMAISGNYLYIGNDQGNNMGFVTGQPGLWLVDISAPDAPRQVRLIPEAGCAGDLEFQGNYAYIANCQDATSELRILDMTYAVTTTFVASSFIPQNTTNFGSALTLSGGDVFLSNGESLYVVDVSNPFSPTLRQENPSFGAAYDLLIENSLLYLARGDYGLGILDATDPVNLSLIGAVPNHNPLFWPFRSVIRPPYAYITDSQAGFKVFDISDLAHPALLSTFHPGGNDVMGLAVEGNYAYVGVANEGLYVVDISDPLSLGQAGFIPFAESRPVDIAVAGEYAYVAGADTGLRVIHIADPANLSQVSSVPTIVQTREVAVNGNRLYLSATDGLHILDVSDPAAPLQVGFFNAPSAKGFDVDGNRVYLATFAGFYVVDVTDPFSPTRAGFFDGTTVDAAHIGSYVYLAGAGLKVLNVADPQRLVEAQFIPDVCSSNLALFGKFLFLTGCNDGLKIFAPVGPRPMNIYPNSGDSASERMVWVDGENFQPQAAAFLGDFALLNVTIVSPTSLTATIPAGLPMGTYDLRVVNPDGVSGWLRRAYTVVGSFVPQVDAVKPRQGPDNRPIVIDIFGSNFTPDTSVEFSNITATIQLENVAFMGSFHLRATAPISLPLGMYDLKATNPEIYTGVLTDAYQVVGGGRYDDLYAFPTDLWLDPPYIHAGKPVLIGLTLRRQGGSSPVDVAVNYYLGDPAAGGTLMGSSVAANLPPNGNVSTQPITWTMPFAGVYQVYAVIDPAGQFSETVETNNIISRTIKVLPAFKDIIPPEVTGVNINNRAPVTAIPQVVLNTGAVDNSGQVAYLLFVEYEYVQADADWMITQISGWLPYTTTYQDYSWSLTPSPGVHYLQAWAADAAGNVSLAPALAAINLIPAEAHVTQGQVFIFRLPLKAGDRLQVSLTSVWGDADLYVFAPDGSLVGSSFSELGSDVVEFIAPRDGVYQIEVEGYTSANFNLASVLNNIPLLSQALPTELGPYSIQKSGRITPSTAPGGDPGEDVGLPGAPAEIPPVIVYLPLVMR